MAMRMPRRAGTARATKASPGEEVHLLETRPVLPGYQLLTWAAQDIARKVQPGQFVYVLAPRAPGLLLPAAPVAGVDRLAGRIRLLISADTGHEALRSLRAGDVGRFEGPLGRGFEIDAHSRYLLVVTDVAGFARVGASVEEAVASGRQVTLLLGARTAAEVLPSSLLPDEAEYVVATTDGTLGHHGSVADLVSEYEAWADQCLAAGSTELLTRLVRLAEGRRARMGVAKLGRKRRRGPEPRATVSRRRAWLQLALPHQAGCALGVCLGCVATGERGPLRVCREGPAFAAGELRWETGS
jgi:dihydroorotate dehydrogenase electron transfer subunit